MRIEYFNKPMNYQNLAIIAIVLSLSLYIPTCVLMNNLVTYVNGEL